MTNELSPNQGQNIRSRVRPDAEDIGATSNERSAMATSYRAWAIKTHGFKLAPYKKKEVASPATPEEDSGTPLEVDDKHTKRVPAMSAAKTEYKIGEITR